MCKANNNYMDGPKMEYGVGTGIYCPELGIRQPFELSDYCSIFKGKGFAIVVTVELTST